MRAIISKAALAVLSLVLLSVPAAEALAVNLEDALFYGADALYQGNYARAERGFSSALEIDPENPFALTGRGDALTMLGRAKEAGEAYDKALAASPNNLLALRGLGLLALSQNDGDKAAASFNAMLKSDPDNPNALTLLALTRALAGDAPQAVANLERAAPRASSQDHHLAGRIYASLGMPQNARLSLERCLENDATNPDVLEEIGALYQRQERSDLAQSAFRQALALNPGRPVSRAALSRLVADQALAAEQAGQTGKAAYLWDAVLEYDPGNVQALAARQTLKTPRSAPAGADGAGVKAPENAARP